MNKTIVPIIAILILVAGFFLFSSQNNKQMATDTNKTVATIYKSPDCGCCTVYSQYLKKEGYSVVVKEIENMDDIKKQFNIPDKLQSCHTMTVGEYVVEGHVPSEAIKKLLAEKPVINGIALPGMPSGSPGMPGPKREIFEISSFFNGALLETFMSI